MVTSRRWPKALLIVATSKKSLPKDEEKKGREAQELLAKKKAEKAKGCIALATFFFVGGLILYAFTPTYVGRPLRSPRQDNLAPRPTSPESAPSTKVTIRHGTESLRLLSEPTTSKPAIDPTKSRKPRVKSDLPTCTLGHTVPSHTEIVINRTSVLQHSKSRLKALTQFTFPKYEKHMMNRPGKEHYTLLEFMTEKYADCRHVVDIGTRYVASALALGAHQTPVLTFDIPASQERKHAFRGKTEEEWMHQVQRANVNITFHNLDLLAVSHEDFKRYMSTWMIMLDTFHEPDSTPFEREWFDRLLAINFQGLLFLDDINFNSEMRKWWAELQGNATEHGYVTYDLTSIGHFSGTGLLDFSGRVRVLD